MAQEPVPQAARLGPEVGERLACWLREAGVELVLDAEVDGIEDGRRVPVAGGPEIVLLAAGVAPNVLTHECDKDYERGRELIAPGKRL